MSAGAAVYVVIVGYRGERWLPQCLSTLVSACRRPIDVLLVDNGGNGPLKRYTSGSLSVRIVQTSAPMGFAEANNFGLVHRSWEAPAVCFLNQDTAGEPGWLDACLECFEAHPDVGAVSPLLKTLDGQGWDAGFAACTAADAAFQRDAGSGTFRDFYDVAEVTAAAMVVRSDVLRTVGPFDPIFGSYYEDFDLCRRIRNERFRVGVSGQGTVRHFGGSGSMDPDSVRRRMRQVLRNRFITHVRDSKCRWQSVCRYCLTTAPRTVVRGILRTPSSQPLSVQAAAYCDLLRIAPRLVSKRWDEGHWQSYLKSIGWNSAGNHDEQLSAAANAPRTQVPA